MRRSGTILSPILVSTAAALLSGCSPRGLHSADSQHAMKPGLSRPSSTAAVATICFIPSSTSRGGFGTFFAENYEAFLFAGLGIAFITLISRGE